MTHREASDEEAALQQARAGLEAALGGNAHWRAFREGDGDRERHEQALSGNPLFKSWKVMTEALESLRAQHEQVADADETAPEAETPPDDLTRIRGVSADLAGRLNSLGIARYGQIAAWRSGDVRRISESLDLGKAISRQNWIEQAALLDRRTHGSRTEAVPSSPVEAPPPSVTEAIAPSPGEQTTTPAQLSATDVEDRAETEPDAEVTAEAIAEGETQAQVDAEAIAEPEDTIDLPDILERIRSDAASRSDSAPVVAADEQDTSDPRDGEPADPQPEPALEPEPESAGDAAPEIAAPPATVAAQEAPAAPAQRSPIPAVAASSHVNTDAAERAKRLEDDRRRLAEQSRDALGPETEEAVVTFVIREPIEEPARGGAPAWYPPPAAHEASQGEHFVPPNSEAAEAEVVIVSTEIEPPAGRRPGSVRRFLKTLTGG